MPTEAEFLALKSRVNELEDKLQFLYRQLKLEYADPGSNTAFAPRVLEALRRGNKIEAIKVYRELTGAGLAEAKRAVEEMESRLGL